MEQIDANQSFVTLTAASASGHTSDIQNVNARGLKVVVDITAISGTSAKLTVTVKAKDQLSGKYYTILTSADLDSTGTTVLTVYPGLTAVSNVTVSDVLPATYQISYVIAGTGPSVTATIGGCLLV